MKTERLTLRLVQFDDAPFIYELYSSKDVCRYYDIEPFKSLQDAVSHIKRWLDFYDLRKQCRFLILQSNKPIGTCGLYLINETHKRASIGYDLLPDYWGNGFMKEAVQCMIKHTHELYGIQRFQAELLQDNDASIKLLEKIGFHKEGLLKKYEYWGEKGFVDLLMYARIYEQGNLGESE